MSETIDVIESKTYIVGREGHIYISDVAVSKYHAELRLIDGKVYLRDLNSTNGTYLLKNKRLVHFQEGNVHPDQPIIMGSKMYTARKLLGIAGTFVSR